jgi:Ca-activated chloride channel family protein
LSFAEPVFLLALLALPAAVAALAIARRRARRYSVRFTGVPTIFAVATQPSMVRRHLPSMLFLLALAVAATALARPQATTAIPVEHASVVLVTDASRSMQATDVDPNRLKAAQEAAERFLDRVPEALQVGVVGFSESAHTLKEPTTDHDEVEATLDALVADGGTATGDALVSALRMLDRDESDRPTAAIVLLSDGKTTTGRDPVEVAREARRLRVPIYTVALGTPSGAIPASPYGGGVVRVPPDPETMRRVARISRGRAFTAGNAGELDTVYERLSTRIGTRERKREITAGFAAGGMALLIAAAAFSLRWSGRLP